ncbi:peptidoglycan-binding protein [Marinobacter sp. NP-4(2019)]|uniref:AAA family ATPase n=1 Tax=Marinobacter sp. NP-4(2019) TaxID=2488665 RepID=UPI000FC3DAEF|nr:AAA family ATPase [Marinobacter sp. NP-4(2019)]AZT84062.1 peptidoglycan-binding protein [Marinobacter sp. NP-4(2019)]
MYYDFFGFREPPFSIAPDPRYLFLSERHKEALAHLMYGVQGQGGFIVITGEVGTGKTTVSRCFIENVPDHVDIALILNPRLSARELLSSICDELEIPHPVGASIKQLVDLINTDLLKAHGAGRHKVLMIDEAQNLSADVLEQLRLLTNLETAEKKLLQIVLLGQPELQELLARPELRQLNQRVTARYHLDALSRDELPGYLRYRLGVAGLRADIFTGGAIKKLFKVSNGIPRLINLISDRALLGAYAEGEHVITASHIRTAAKEVNGSRSPAARPVSGRGVDKPRYLALAASVLVAIIGTVWLFERWQVGAEASTPLTGEQGVAVTGTIERADPVPEPESPEPLPEPVAEPARLFEFDTHGQSQANAFRSLFDLWGADYVPSDNPEACIFARIRGLACLARQGTRRSLELLNRPAILELRNAEGQRRYVTIQHLDGKQAVVATPEGTESYSFDSLEAFWFGEFTVLWQLPPYMDDSEDSSEASTEQLWLSSRMMELADLLSTGREQSDQIKRMETREQVRWYQQKKGLVVDGIAGAMTLIQITNDLDEKVPRLVSTGASQGDH